MVKFFFISILSVLVFFSSLTTTGQNISGKIADTGSKKNISNAVIALLKLPDSTLYKFTRSNTEGEFIIKNASPGKYLLLVTHPYFADLLDKIEIQQADISLNQLSLINKSKLLQEVIVKSGSPIKIKGDTTIYTADSFKVSANADVEELLRKLPGITVDKNGTITAMGETVSNVLVDGEEFFGDDPGMAIKNLRADAVKEVQVYDKKTDQATFTGIDDGNTQKTINLKLKDDKKKGYFGKIDLSGGLLKNIEDRYNNNLMFSTFKGKRKISGYLLNGNTGQDGLSWQDNDKFGGTSDMVSINMDDNDGVGIYIGRVGSSDDEPYVNTENGFIKNINAGLQYSNKWNERHSFNFSPKYNQQNYTNSQTDFIQTLLGDSVLNYRSATNTHVYRNNIKTSMVYDVKIDSNNSIKITNKVNAYHTESEELKKSESRGGSGILKNLSTGNITNNIDKFAISGDAIFRHRFAKARRTFAVTAGWNFINSDSRGYLKSDNEIYTNGNPSSSLSADQYKLKDKSTLNISSKITYTEPLSKTISLEIANEISASNGKNNQTAFTFSEATGKYDEAIDSLTNDFKQTIFTDKPSAKINYATKKIKFNVGSGIGFTTFNLKDITYNKDYERHYINFFPTANFNYSYKSNRNLRIRYNGNTTQPTLNQLQPLRNNDDYFNQYIGNPNLKPSFANEFNISHNSYDFIKDKWTYASLDVKVTNNSITNNKTINPVTGKTITQPINTNGNLSVRFWSGYGSKIKKWDIRYNISPQFSYSRLAEVINSESSYSKTFTTGLSFRLSKNKEKKYDISLNNDFNYNNNITTLSTTTAHYSTNSLYLDATIYIKKVWSVNGDYQYHYRQRTSELTQNINTHLFNARLQRTFKKDEFTVYIAVKDIFNQNIGIDRSYYSNTYTETTNDRLKRYCMLGFVWNFKNAGADAVKPN